MHRREKRRESPRISTKQAKIRFDFIDDYQILIDPKGFETREKWLQQELTESCSILNPIAGTNLDLKHLNDVFSACIEDVKHPNVSILAGQLLLCFCLWQNDGTMIGGLIEKNLIQRVSNPNYPYQLRENAVSVLTILHALDILHIPKNFRDSDMAPKNRRVDSKKYLESFFKILTELIKSVVANITQENTHVEESNSNSADDMDEFIESDESDESIEESTESEVVDPKDSLLENIINAWGCLVLLISEEKFDTEFPEYFEMFQILIKHYKNQTIKIASCEVLITISDLNERLAQEKQYDIEIQPIVDQLYRFAKAGYTKRELKEQKNQRQAWINLAKALEADKCVVALPFIGARNKFMITPAKNQVDRKKLYQDRSTKRTLWTNWPEAMTIKFIKNILGHQFNALMQNSEFSSSIFRLLEEKNNSARMNIPLSMVYVQMKKADVPHKAIIYGTDENYNSWISKWGRKSDKEGIKNMIRNGDF